MKQCYTPAERERRRMERAAVKAAELEVARAECRTECERQIAGHTAALLRIPAGVVESYLVVNAAGYVAQVVDATFRLRVDDLCAYHTKQLRTGEPGKDAMNYARALLERARPLTKRIRQAEKHLSARKTLDSKYKVLRELNTLRIVDHYQNGTEFRLSECFPAVIFGDGTAGDLDTVVSKPLGESAAAACEPSAPLTLAEALFRDQRGYLEREAERGRVALEKREVIERAANELQAERERGTAADFEMTRERMQREVDAVTVAWVRETYAAQNGPAVKAFRAMEARRKAVCA